MCINCHMCDFRTNVGFVLEVNINDSSELFSYRLRFHTSWFKYDLGVLKCQKFNLHRGVVLNFITLII